MSERRPLLFCSFDVFPAPTGISRRTAQYLLGLSRRFNVVMLSVKGPDDSHIEKRDGAKILRVPVGQGDFSSRLQAFDRAVRRQLNSEEYVLAHFTDPFAGTPLCESREAHGYRLVYEALTFPSLEPPAEIAGESLAHLRRRELTCLMKSDRVLTGSEVTRSFIRSLGVPENRVAVLQTPASSSLQAAARTGTLRVAYVGSGASWQGLETLLQAVHLASAQIEIRLVIIGTAASSVSMDDSPSSLVELHPAVPHDEVLAVLETCDVATLPLANVERNRLAGGPCSKVADYLGAGLPIVASDLPLARDTVPSYAARFVSAGDASGFADAFVELARSPDTRMRMSGAARDAAIERHDPEEIRRRLLAVYGEIVDLSAHPPRNSPSIGGSAAGRPPFRGRRRGGTDPAIANAPPASSPAEGAPLPSIIVDASLRAENSDVPAPEPKTDDPPTDPAHVRSPDRT